MSRKPLVALVGRPNVGKSTLFNRLVGGRRAIVEEVPGTTRDRQYGDAEWGGHIFTLADTGGLVLGACDTLTELVRRQAQIAIQEADVIVFLTDITEGLTASDAEIADVLRRTRKPIILATNKADNLKREMGLHEFYALGLGDPLALSALRGMGTGELLESIVGALPVARLEEGDSDLLHIALVGRPNVGKSSLLNQILGEDRVIVDKVPGTTRDAIDTLVRYHGEDIVLIDTAGIRRRGSIKRGVEKYSVLRALKAIGRADVVLLLIDAAEGVVDQDAHVAGYILEQAKSVILLLNKWDLIEKDTHTLHQFEQHVRRELKFMSYVPVLSVSALTGQRVSRILPLALRLNEERQRRLSTSQINDVLRKATARHSPPTKWGRKLRLYYGTQVGNSPPTFVIFVNDEQLLHFSYKRYLANQIRQRYKFAGTPLNLIFRGHKPKRGG